MRCAQCRGLVLKDAWYQVRDGQVFHVKACKVHPDVAKARADSEAATP